MRRVSIRQKLAAAIALPLAGLVIVTGLEVLHSRREADEVREQSRLAQATLGPNGLLAALQAEALVGSSSVVGVDPGEGLPVANNEEARAATDKALEEFRGHIEAAGGTTLDAYEPVIAQLDGLQTVRDKIDAYTGPAVLESGDVEGAIAPGMPTEGLDLANEAYLDYSALITPFYDANTKIADAVGETELRNGTDLVNLAARQTDLAGGLLSATARAEFTGEGIDARTELPDIATLLGTYDRQDEQIRRLATGRYAPLAETLFAAEKLERFHSLITGAVENLEVDPTALLEARLSFGNDEYTLFRDDVAEVLADEASQRNDAAATREQRFLLLAALVLGLAFVTTWLTARSITRPLRSLTAQAKDVAERRLPGALREVLDRPLGADVSIPVVEPVRVDTRDEVTDVAVAISSVQDTAVDLAVEQAVLRRNIADAFVSLGRRNQNLLIRQLDFITHLESDETDPDTLASLFRLDHLATRMRRNAESLLLLAGAEPSRRWAAPVAVKDVVRAALSEVEGYERVVLSRVDPATVVGATAAELAHLLAELLDNALAFSPPDRSVLVQGVAAPDGYVLSIVDAGLGMAPSDLEAANRRLSGAESFTVAPSKYLGHYVAGHLAAIHGMRVRLDGGSGRGLTATVSLPLSVMAGYVNGEGAPKNALAGPPPGPPSPVPAHAGAGAGARPGPSEPGWLPRSPFVPASAVEGPWAPR